MYQPQRYCQAQDSENFIHQIKLFSSGMIFISFMQNYFIIYPDLKLDIAARSITKYYFVLCLWFNNILPLHFVIQQKDVNSNIIFSIKDLSPFYCLIFQLFPANNFLFFFINSLQSTFYLIDIFCYNSSLEYW